LSHLCHHECFAEHSHHPQMTRQFFFLDLTLTVMEKIQYGFGDFNLYVF
jgi:hypothetical protein